MSAFTMEKIAVFAPMESASVRITVTVKPGLRRNWRAANLRFLPKASIDDPLGEPSATRWTWRRRFGLCVVSLHVRAWSTHRRLVRQDHVPRLEGFRRQQF